MLIITFVKYWLMVQTHEDKQRNIDYKYCTINYQYLYRIT